MAPHQTPNLGASGHRGGSMRTALAGRRPSSVPATHGLLQALGIANCLSSSRYQLLACPFAVPSQRCRRNRLPGSRQNAVARIAVPTLQGSSTRAHAMATHIRARTKDLAWRGGWDGMGLGRIMEGFGKELGHGPLVMVVGCAWAWVMGHGFWNCTPSIYLQMCFLAIPRGGSEFLAIPIKMRVELCKTFSEFSKHWYGS